MTWEEKNTSQKYIITVIVSFIPELFFSWIVGKMLTVSMWYVWIGLQMVKIALWILRSAVGFILFHLVWKNEIVDSTYCSLVEHQYPNPKKYVSPYFGIDYFSDVMWDDEIKMITRLDAAGAHGVFKSMASKGFLEAWRMETVIGRAIDKYHRVNFSGRDYQGNSDANE